MDYRDLLKKYIVHVEYEEGITFVPHYDEPVNHAKDGGADFTIEEVRELQAIEKEAMNE